MANKCFIMRGCSGAGKSTYVATRLRYDNPAVVSFSADDFWIDSGGVYRFDPARLGEAHSWNLRRFTEFVSDMCACGADGVCVVVDNTNTTIAEIAPYYAVAQAFGFDVEIVTLTTKPEIAHPRNAHGVPQKVVERQYRDMIEANRAIPGWWNHTIS